MNYISTRNKNIVKNDKVALLQGLSEDGGLFVLENFKDKIDLEKLLNKSYTEIALEVLKLFFSFDEKKLKSVIEKAYSKFSTSKVTPLVELKKSYILELFHGPTSAFKDVALTLLPHLIQLALEGTNQEILVLTATSGDTGKAALEGFKDVAQTEIIVFYPKNGVSKVQELQMRTQEGKNTKVCAIEGNFDDAQTGVKNIFLDENLQKKLGDKKFSSANSINIGRLTPQIVYYIVSYVELVKNNKIKMGDKINFVVPTGNFGDILAGYYAKKLGLPVNKFVCASNNNNVLYDFLTTGTYDRNREFLKTISPSMDILISSNLERLLYDLSGADDKYIKSLMEDLNKNGKYQVNDEILKKIKEQFGAGYATDEETAKTIKKVWEEEKYLLDPHTAVAYKVMLEQNLSEPTVVLSTASPYKFCASVANALLNIHDEDEFVLMQKLYEATKVEIPENLKNLKSKEILHSDIIKKEEMSEYVLGGK
nr:threonine synthase [uncultured Fusobacterium sp.]